MTVAAVLTATALGGGAALAGALGEGAGTRALHLSILTQAPLPSADGASGAPAVTPAGPSQPGAAMAPGTVRARNVTLQVSPVPESTAGPAPTINASPLGTGSQQAVVVRYTVVSRWAYGFQAEVDVANDGPAPVSGWQIVVALPQDQITSFTNASGYVSHHILLLQPASSSPSIAPGGSLRVSFTAQGSETTPELCAFDNVACG